MESFFDRNGHPKVKLTVGGRKRSGDIDAVLDTGFDGYLSLPVSMAVQLGLELIGTDTVQYADGRTARELVFTVSVKMSGKDKLVPTTLTDSVEALAGTALFSGMKVSFDFASKRISISA